MNSPEVTPERRVRQPAAEKPDPFGLKSGAARLNWQHVNCPLFQLFEFNRIVVDEFTYIKDKDFLFVTTLNAQRRWVLSGTPPLEDFADVKTIARFLGVNLGVEDDAVGVLRNRNIRAIRKDRTSKFPS